MLFNSILTVGNSEIYMHTSEVLRVKYDDKYLVGTNMFPRTKLFKLSIKIKKFLFDFLTFNVSTTIRLFAHNLVIHNRYAPFRIRLSSPLCGNLLSVELQRI